MNQELPDVQAGFRKGRGTRNQITHIHWNIAKARKSQKKNIYLCLTDYAKVFDCVDHNKLWKVHKEMGIQDHLTSWETCMQDKKQVRTGHGTTDGSKLGKEYIKAVYCHPAYLTYIQSTLCKMQGWIYHKLGSRLQGEISITSDVQVIPPLWQRTKRN